MVQRGRAGVTGSAILGALDQELMQVAFSLSSPQILIEIAILTMVC